jgi:ATP-dependent Lon protease
MRKDSLGSLVSQHVELSDNFKIRDERSFQRVASGLLMLILLNKRFDNNELKLVIDMALKSRQRV